MGLAQGGGTNLGTAQGTITINTQGVSASVPVVAAASAQMTASLNNITPAVKKAQASVGNLGDSLKKLAGITDVSSAFKQLAGAFGVSFGIAGVVVASKALLDFGLDSVQAASDLTESINKIDVAFAGSGKAVLDWSKGSAGALGQSRRQALEAASSFGLLFRTMGLGAGTSAEMSEKLVQLAADLASINNISPEEALLKLRSGLVGEAEPLRQVGVLLDETTVKNKAMEMGLALTEKALTQQDKVMARYQLILEQTSLSQGDFARTSGELANQQRILAANIEDSQAIIGKVLKPIASGAVLLANSYIMQQIALAEGWGKALTAVADEYIKLVRLLGGDLGPTSAQRARITSPSERTGIGSNIRQRPVAMDVTPLEGEKQIHLDWAQGIEDLNRQTHEAINDEEKSFGASRAKTVADYNKSVARDEAAYARGRLREQMDFLDALADVGKDATRREAGQASDLARTMGQARSDSAEREVDIREDANKRLVKLDEDYEKDRLKRAQDLSDNLLDAAGDLDAKQVYQLQRDAAKQEQQASDAHDDARKEIGEGLQERLDDERKSLAKSLKQQQDNYDRQLQEGRENDRIRLQDMKDAFVKSQARAKEDHDDQVTQRAEDQAAQLAEMDTQHGLRIDQIKTHAASERLELDAQAKADLLALGVRNAAWKKAQEEKELAQEKLWDKFMEHVNGTLKEGRPNTPQIAPAGFASGGFVPRTGLAYLHAGEVVIPARNVSRGGGGRSISMGDIHISVAGTNASAGDIGRVVRQEMLRVFEEAA